MSGPLPSPPRLARWLLRRVLDGAARSAILGDLDEEFTRFIVAELGVKRARRWYWRQALGSIAACVRGRSVSAPLDGERASLAAALVQGWHGLAGDMKAGLRNCVRRPLLSSVVVVTLALGIGANSAVFSIINGLFLKRLPVPTADRLVAIESGGAGFTFPEYLTARGASGLEAVFAGGRIMAVLEDGGRRDWISVDLVTANYFDALGVRGAAVGRLFHERDRSSDLSPIAVLSDRYWRRQFAADRGVIGRTVRLGRSVFTVVGIAPPEFGGIQIAFAPDAWVPLSQGPLIEGDARMLGPTTAWLGLAGVLAARESFDTAQAGLRGRWRGSGVEHEITLRLIPRGLGLGWFPSSDRESLQVLGGFVVVILMIGCLNVATLLGAGVQARHKELAIRAAVGAGRLRLLRQLLVENLLLASVAGVAGAIVGVWLARSLVVLMAAGSLRDLDVGLDLTVLLFTGAITLASALGFGLMPAVNWSRVSGLLALQGSHGEGMPRMFRRGGLWWFIPWQVALGIVLLASAGVLMKTVHELKLGIESAAPDRVWFANLEYDDLPPSAPAASDGPAQVIDELQTLAGIEAVGISTLRPLAASARTSVNVEGLDTPPPSRPMPWGPPPPPPPRGARLEKRWIVSNSFVSPGFFRALGLPLLQGRDFDNRDRTGAPRVAIVNETFARRAFGQASPLGRRLSHAGSPFNIEIVGLVKDLRYEHLREAAPDGVFFPLAQIPPGETYNPTPTGAMHPRDLTLIVRVQPGGRITAGQLHDRITALEPRALVTSIWTFDDEAGRSLSQERLLAWLGSLFGGFALVLLMIGLYGALTAAVNRSRRELGIRIALGASPRSLSAMVVGRSLAVVACGVALGLPFSYAAARSFIHLLHGVQPVDPLVGAIVVSLILLTTALATYVPARRASRVDPVIALRAE